MPGYPCCCQQKPNCGACQGTAPAQYQLTVPSGVFVGGNCGDFCDDYNGVYLLDYNAELLPITGSSVTCIWESAPFEGKYFCEGESTSDTVWRWRVELSDVVLPADQIQAYVFMRDEFFGYSYLWVGYFTAHDCGGTISLAWVPDFLQDPMPGCEVDMEATLTLEVP